MFRGRGRSPTLGAPVPARVRDEIFAGNASELARMIELQARHPRATEVPNSFNILGDILSARGKLVDKKRAQDERVRAWAAETDGHHAAVAAYDALAALDRETSDRRLFEATHEKGLHVTLCDESDRDADKVQNGRHPATKRDLF